jgi:hypothetical protein
MAMDRIVGRIVVFTLTVWQFTTPVWAGAPKPPVEKKQTHAFPSSRMEGSLDRVVVQLEVGGELKEKEGGKTQSMPVSGTCQLEYDEKTLETPAEKEGCWRSARMYDKAEASIKRGDEELKPALRIQRSLIAVQIDSKASTIFSPKGPLTRDELEMTDVLGNSLLLEQFLPEKSVDIGQTWTHSEKLIALLLDLDTVTKCDVQSTLKEVTDAVARFELSGHVEGTSEDAATEIELTGKYRYDLRLKRIDWFGLLVKEQRGISRVTAGFNVSSRLQVRIVPKDASVALSDAVLKDYVLKPDKNLTQLSCEPANGGWQLHHDRRWHLYREQNDLIVLRLVDGGEYIGQCNISSLAKRSPEKQISLSEFQEDTRRVLAKSFGKFVAAEESSDASDHRVLRVVIRGEVSDVPIQWNYYLVADSQGNQAALAFTMEEKIADRLNKADEQLVQAIKFVEQKSIAENKTEMKK